MFKSRAGFVINSIQIGRITRKAIHQFIAYTVQIAKRMTRTHAEKRWLSRIHKSCTLSVTRACLSDCDEENPSTTTCRDDSKAYLGSHANGWIMGRRITLLPSEALIPGSIVTETKRNSGCLRCFWNHWRGSVREACLRRTSRPSGKRRIPLFALLWRVEKKRAASPESTTAGVVL